MHTNLPTVDSIIPTPKSEMIKTHPGHTRRYTVCRALREIYVKTDDPEIREKLRYACTIAEYLTRKIDQHDPGWLKDFYPRRYDFSKIMNRPEKE